MLRLLSLSGKLFLRRPGTERPQHQKIEGAAVFLSTKPALVARPYLDEPYQLALNILDQMRDGVPRTCQEIAALIESRPHFQSINQALMALERGGIIFQRSEGNPVARNWSLPEGQVRLQIMKPEQ